MSYFPSARAAARALGIPLLLRVDPDPRAFRRHDWLGTLAAPAASAARMHVRALDSMSRADGVAAGARGGTPLSPGATWVTGPWGSLAHLPWAVGLADHLARARGRAGLLEREPDGPLRTLARPGRRIPLRLSLAEALLGGLVDAVNTDLEGVSILLPGSGEGRVEGGSTDAAAGDFPLVLADGLPEALEGPYPGADWVAGVILVASFRDHSRFELDAMVRRLRETGHRLLGLMAIGPEVSDTEEEAALRAEMETEPVAREAARAKQEAPRPRVDAAPAEAEAPPAQRGTPRPASGPEVRGEDSFPAAARIPHAHPGVALPAAASPPIPPPPPVPASLPVPPPPPIPASLPVPPPPPVPLSPSVLPPASEPASRPVLGPLVGPTSASMPKTRAGAGLETGSAAGSETGSTAGLETDLGEPSAESNERATIPLFSTWDRLTIGRSRQRRRVGSGVTALMVLAAAAAFYAVVLRPRLSPLSWPSIFRGQTASPPSEGVDSTGEVASAAADSTAPAVESTGTASGWTGVAGESTGTVEASIGAAAESSGTATASMGAAADSTRTVVDSTGTAAGSGRMGADGSRTPGEESGSGMRPPAPRSAPGPTARPATGPPVNSRAAPVASPGFERSLGLEDTTVALPSGAEIAAREQFVIHLTSFKLEVEAAIEVAALGQRGIGARSIQVEIPDRGTWYRIVTGNFATFAEAESVALRLQAEGQIPYAHIAADGGRGRPVPVGTLDRARP